MRLVAGELALRDQVIDQIPELEVGQFGGHLEHLLPQREVIADLQCLGGGVVAVQHGVAEIDAAVDVHPVHLGEPARQLPGQIAVVQPHLDGELLGGGVQLVQVVLPSVEVVAHLLVRHGDRSAAAAVGEPLLGGGRQLRGGDPVTAVQVDHRPRQPGMSADHFGDLGRVDVDVEVAVRVTSRSSATSRVSSCEEKNVASTPNTSVMRSSTATVRGERRARSG